MRDFTHPCRGYLRDRTTHGLATFVPSLRTTPGEVGIATPGEVGIADSAVPPILDQTQTGSCTGQGTSNAIAIWARVHGVDLGLGDGEVPSPKTLYTTGRALQRAANCAGQDPLTFPPLEDGGCEPAFVIRGAASHGLTALVPTGPVRDDCYPETINQELDTATIIRADGLRLLGPARIVSPVGSALSADLRAALASLAPVGLALCASGDDFQAYSGGVLDGTCYQPADHWVCAIRYRMGANGWEYRIVNSWGEGWGDNGMIWVTDRWLTGSISDATVFGKLEVV